MKRILTICLIATAWLGALRVHADDGSSGQERVAQLEAKVDRTIAAVAALESRLTLLERRASQSGPALPAVPGATAPSPTPTPPAPPGMSEPRSPEPQEVTVYVTRTGSKYHRAGCSYLKSSIPMTLSRAKAEGYSPCSRCNPP